MKTLILGLGIVVALWLVLVAALLVAGRRTAAREAVALVPNVIRLFRGLLEDPRVPWSSKLLLVFGAAWIASPVDLIPELIPIAGPLDDAIVAALILRRLLRTVGREVLTDHWRGTPAALERLVGKGPQREQAPVSPADP